MVEGAALISVELEGLGMEEAGGRRACTHLLRTFHLAPVGSIQPQEAGRCDLHIHSSTLILTLRQK